MAILFNNVEFSLEPAWLGLTGRDFYGCNIMTMI